MTEKLKQYNDEFLAKGESPAMALILAQTKQLTIEFSAIKHDLHIIKKGIKAHFGEAALSKMDSDE